MSSDLKIHTANALACVIFDTEVYLRHHFFFMGPEGLRKLNLLLAASSAGRQYEVTNEDTEVDLLARGLAYMCNAIDDGLTSNELMDIVVVSTGDEMQDVTFVSLAINAQMSFSNLCFDGSSDAS